MRAEFHPLISRFTLGSKAQEIGAVALTGQRPSFPTTASSWDSQRGRAFTSEASSSWSLVETGAGCLAGLQEITGLPCWATISLATVALRVGLLPFTIKQRQAVSAMGLVARETPRPAGDEAADVNALEKVKFYARVAKRWNQEKGERGMAGPVWLFTPVFAHLPSFVTMMWTVKYMAASGEYGFETGGLFWFKDLTLPAVDLVSMTAPMGALGAILPATLIATYIFNMQQLFGNKQGPGTTTDLFLRSFLEMLTIPMLIIGLQLPHGIFCYWLTSSTFNMIQNPLLNHEYTQKLLGNRQRLPIKREAAETEQRLTIEQEETAGASVERGATTASSTLPPSEKLFEKARELSSSGRESDQFMLGEKGIQALSYEQVTSIAKTLAKKGDWKQAHQLFLVAATKCEDLDSANHIQSLFWAGIASAKLGYKENAIELFTNVIKRDSKNTQSMLALANIHQKDENVEGARQWIERAAALDSKIKEAFLDPFNRDNPPSG